MIPESHGLLINLARGPLHPFWLSADIITVPQMPFTSHNKAAVTEGQAVGLLGIIDPALGNDMALSASLIEHGISGLQIAHPGKTVRRRDQCVDIQLFSIFLWDLHIGCPKLPRAVLLHDPEHIPDDLLLPGEQPERFPAPAPLGVAEVFDEANRPVSFRLVVMGLRKHEPGRLVVLQFWVILRSLLCHQLPPSRSSISSIGAFFRSAPAVILLLAEGVRPNCSAILFMILR